MRYERITSAFLHDTKLEWTALRQSKALVETLSSGTVDMMPTEENPVSGQLIADSLKKNDVEPSAHAVIGVSSAQMMMKIVRLPTLIPEEMDGMIRLQADKMSPFPEEKIVVGYETLEYDETGCTVFIAVLPSDLVEENGNFFSDAGFTLRRIDANILAWWKLIQNAHSVLPQGRQISVLLSDNESYLIATQDGSPVAFRFVPQLEDSELSEFADELVDNISTLLLALDLEFATSEFIACNIYSKGPITDLIAEKIETVFGVKPAKHDIDSIPSLTEGLARRALLKFPKNPRKDQRFKGPDAVLDFLPEKWRTMAEAKQLKKILAVSSVVLGVVWLFCIITFILALSFKSTQMRHVEASQAETEAASTVVKELRDQVVAFERYLNRSESALECLREISVALPEEFNLGGFQYRKGRTLALRGESLSVNPIYDFKEALDNSELFSAVNIGTTRPATRDGATIQTVQITATMAGSE
ncbi:MAG: pilus assembly protein PilM [Lentisphaerae bacterium]|nr:pilus assembly protein PilM [Lentisphaerota bacterium]